LVEEIYDYESYKLQHYPLLRRTVVTKSYRMCVVASNAKRVTDVQ